MEITAPNSIPTPNSAATNAPTNSLLSSDFETFLRMLTAQARYQDPLEPLDSSEYAGQLAQFSMVEQQVLSNDILNALATQLGNGNLAQLAGWIGLEALTTAPVYFDGTPVQVNPNPAAVSDEVYLVVRDQNGTEVQRLALPVSAQPVDWAGVTEGGSPFQPGVYSFEVESWSQGELILSEPATTYARITEAQRQGDDTMLVLSGGASVLASDVTGLREPG